MNFTESIEIKTRRFNSVEAKGGEARESEDGEIEKKRVGDSETLTEKLSNVVSFSLFLFFFLAAIKF